MGCSQSKIENEEAVTRCKERKQFMKDSVSSRNAFAAAHSAYAIALKNTGAALSDYTHGEVAGGSHHSHHPSHPSPPSSFPAGPSSSSVDSLPPPPPLPNFQNAPPPPLHRAVSMPEMIAKPEPKPVGPTIIEEDEDLEFEAQDNEKLTRKRSANSSSRSRGDVGSQQPPPPMPAQQWKEEEVMRSAPVNHHHQGSSWGDYIFAPVETMPAPTLAEDVDEEVIQRVRRVSRLEVGPTPSTVVIEELDERVEKAVQEEVAESVSRVSRMEVGPPPPMVVIEELDGKMERAVEVPVPGLEKKGPKKGGGEVGRRPVKPVSLMQIFSELDDHFLKASESAHEVSKMLEATRLHYHSNFADNRGHIDHSKRVMRVITWNRSFKGMPSVDDGKDEFDEEDHETHATILDKMLAWEKKLYDEVKAGEIMKYEYQKKVAMLNRQKKRGSNSESLEKLKAAVSHLHTRYIVDMQSMDSTVAEINRLRDERLYPKLVQLVEGMATMWETMRFHHDTQLKIVYALRSLDISQSPKETTEYHYSRTCQLYDIVRDWHIQFCRLIDNQKDYIKALNNWLKLNLIPIESNFKEKVSSPPRVQNPPIHMLLIAWQDYLEKLPDDAARSAINNFAAVVQTIVHHQEEEMKMKQKCEVTRKELERRIKLLDDWKNKHHISETFDELSLDGEEVNPHKNAMIERQGAIELLKKQLEEEEETRQKISLQVREKSLASLKTRLPELFRAMTDISLACADMYSTLKSIAHKSSS